MKLTRHPNRSIARRRLRPFLTALEDRLAPAAFSIVQQPVAVQARVGQAVVFSAAADAPGLSVRWQSSADAGASWSDLPDGGGTVTVADATRTWYRFATAPGEDGRRFRAVFLADPSDPLPTASAALTLTRAPSSIAVTPSASPRSTGEPMTVTVQVASGEPGLPPPSGGLARVSVGPLQFAGVLVDGSAVFEIPDTLDPGSYAFQASYDGDAFVAPVSASLDPLAVQRGTGRITVEIPREAASGAATTLTAYVDHWLPEGRPNPGGVIFLDSGRPIDFVQLTRRPDGRYAASMSTAKLAAGDHYFQLVFLGNPRTYSVASGVYRTTIKPAGSPVQPGFATPLGAPAPPATTSGSPHGSPQTFGPGDATNEPFSLLTKLSAGLNDGFGLGLSASADGSILAVGAYDESISGSGGNGTVSVYVRSGDAWDRAAHLSAAGAGYFGFDVALSADGSTLAVGAPLTAVDGRTSQGAVYVYSRAGDAWRLAQTLTASDGGTSERFGYSVAIGGDGRTIAVGAERGLGVSTLMVSAYVFAREAGVWSQQVELDPSEGEQIASGRAVNVEVAADGATLLVSALMTGLPGGFAVVYSKGEGGWTRDFFLHPSNYPGVASLAATAALSPDGKTLAAPAAIRVSPTRERFVVLVFDRSGSSWTLAATLAPPDSYSADSPGAGGTRPRIAFGLDGATIFAGAPYATVSAEASRGAVHVFERSGGSWAHVARLTAADGLNGDAFGSTTVASAGTIFVTAYRLSSFSGNRIPRGFVYAYRDARGAVAIPGPADQTVLAGAAATFAVGAAGAFASVRWQMNDGAGWVDVAGAEGLVLTIRPALAQSGRRFRAVFRTAGGVVSASEPATLTVVEHRVGLALNIRDNPRRVGDPLVITVVAGSPTTAAPPGGAVELALGTFRMTAALIDGVARFSIPTTLAMGAHVATASYAGDGRGFGAASASAPLTVVRGSSSLTAEIPAVATAGTTTRITAVLTHSGTVAVPAGGVMFMDGGRPIAFEQLSVDALGRVTATFATAGLAPGDHYFQLVYLGNPGTYPSSTPAYKLTIVKAVSAATATPIAADFSRISKASQAANALLESVTNSNATAPALIGPAGPARAGLARTFAGRMRPAAGPARAASGPIAAPRTAQRIVQRISIFRLAGI